MKRLHKLNMRPAEAMQPLPKLASGVDPYKKINKRYLDHDERIHIADWRREGVSIREIARRLGRCHSTISRSCVETIVHRARIMLELHKFEL